MPFTVHFPRGVPGYLLFCIVNGQTEGHGWKICSPQAPAVEWFVSLLARLVLAGCSKLGVFGSIFCPTHTHIFLPGSWPWGDQPHSPGDMDRVVCAARLFHCNIWDSVLNSDPQQLSSSLKLNLSGVFLTTRNKHINTLSLIMHRQGHFSTGISSRDQ